MGLFWYVHLEGIKEGGGGFEDLISFHSIHGQLKNRMKLSFTYRKKARPMKVRKTFVKQASRSLLIQLQSLGRYLLEKSRLGLKPKSAEAKKETSL